MTERTIPLLACQIIQPIVDFSTALGYEVTFPQKYPCAYVVVERGDVEPQFLGMKEPGGRITDRRGPGAPTR